MKLQIKFNPQKPELWPSVIILAALIVVLSKITADHSVEPNWNYSFDRPMAGSTLITEPVEVDDRGWVTFRWQANIYSDSYLLVFLAGDLGWLHEVPASGRNYEELPSRVFRSSDIARYWRIVGIKDGRPNAISQLRKAPGLCQIPETYPLKTTQ